MEISEEIQKKKRKKIDSVSCLEEILRFKERKEREKRKGNRREREREIL